MMYVSKARVTPNGPFRTARFPLDMLRYDACFPTSQQDVTSLADALDRVRGASIMLTQYSDSKTGRWTPGRWESFGWTLEVGRNTQAVAL